MGSVSPPVATTAGLADSVVSTIPEIATGSPAYCQTATPRMVGNSGTAAANANVGNLTLGTALDAIYGPTNNNCPGIWIYLPSTALAAPNNVAGWYWAVMTSTTVGTVYAAQPVNGGVSVVDTPAPESGGSPGVAIAAVVNPFAPPTAPLTIATGSGNAYTGVTTAIPGAVYACPGGSVQPSGSIDFTGVASANNSAGAKTHRGVISAASALSSPAVVASNALTTGVSAVMTAVAALWLGVSNAWRFITAGSTPTFSSIDASATIYVGETLQVAVATDWLIAQQFRAVVNQF